MDDAVDESTHQRVWIVLSRLGAWVLVTLFVWVHDPGAAVAQTERGAIPLMDSTNLMSPGLELLDGDTILKVGDSRINLIVVEDDGRVRLVEPDRWAPAIPIGEQRPGYIAPFATSLRHDCPGRLGAGLRARIEGPPARTPDPTAPFVIIVEWLRLSDEECSPYNELTFSAELHFSGERRRDRARLLTRIVFRYEELTYTSLPHPAPSPRVGIALATARVELYPPELDLPSVERRRILLEDSSDRAGPGGMWVMDLDQNGELDNDADGDGLRGGRDNCIGHYNPLQYDLDCDGLGDECDDPVVEVDTDGDHRADFCDGDDDGDGVGDLFDNCTLVYNPNQLDRDADWRGDVCDYDPDGDGVPTLGVFGGPRDVCPLTPDPEQRDRDGDGMGDACDLLPLFDLRGKVGVAFDSDADGDGIADRIDVCPTTPDPDQRDTDGTPPGDRCESLSARPTRCTSSAAGWRGDCWDGALLPSALPLRAFR